MVDVVFFILVLVVWVFVPLLLVSSRKDRD